MLMKTSQTIHLNRESLEKISNYDQLYHYIDLIPRSPISIWNDIATTAMNTDTLLAEAEESLENQKKQLL